jgi:hypothetical protein
MAAIVKGAIAPGATADEVAAEIAARPSFAGNPTGDVASATARAATAYEQGRLASSRLWANVAELLIEAADSPHVRPGVVLQALRRRLP